MFVRADPPKLANEVIVFLLLRGAASFS